MSEVHLIVNGVRYGGWKSISVTRTIESIAGAFSLEANDRWGQSDEPTPIHEEDECRVEIDNEKVVDGYIDKVDLDLVAPANYAGRDRCAALIDNSVLLDNYQFKNIGLLQMAKKIADPFGVKVSVAAGVTLPKAPPKITISPGETGWEVISKVARSSGVLTVNDGHGGIQFTQAGTENATPLVQGNNMLSGRVTYNAVERFSNYVVMTQKPGRDGSAGGATRIRATATDDGVRRTERVRIVRPDNGVDSAYAKKRADWEARVHAARAAVVTVGVQGWREPTGELWRLNHLSYVFSPRLKIDGELLIVSAEHTIGQSGQITVLRLMRPDAFAPEPQAVVKEAKGGKWRTYDNTARVEKFFSQFAGIKIK